MKTGDRVETVWAGVVVAEGELDHGTVCLIIDGDGQLYHLSDIAERGPDWAPVLAAAERVLAAMRERRDAATRRCVEREEREARERRARAVTMTVQRAYQAIAHLGHLGALGLLRDLARTPPGSWGETMQAERAWDAHPASDIHPGTTALDALWVVEPDALRVCRRREYEERLR